MGLILPARAGSRNVMSGWLIAVYTGHGVRVRNCVSPPNLSLPWLQMRLVKEPPKYSYLGQANENPNLPEIAVKQLTPGGFLCDLVLEGCHCPGHSWQNLQGWLTEEVRLKHGARWEESTLFGKGNFMVLGYKVSSHSLLRMKRKWRG